MFLRSRLILFLQGVPDFSAPKIVRLIGDITLRGPGASGAFVACVDAGMVYCKMSFCVLEMYAAVLAADQRGQTGRIGSPSSLVIYRTEVASPRVDGNRHGTCASGNPFFGCLRELSPDGLSRVRQAVADQLREVPMDTANATTRCPCPSPHSTHNTHARTQSTHSTHT